jgi:hypothetical protein
MKLNKLNLVSGVALAAIAVSAVTPAFAAEEVGGQTNSQGTITFSEDGDGGEEGGGGGIIDPVDPENPDIEEPGGGGNGGGDMEGPLTIDFVSGIDFGNRKISGSTQKYYAKYNGSLNSEGETVYLPTFVQVTDNRGKNDGWKLEVSNTQFVDADTDEELAGAVLTLGSDNQVFTQNDNGDTTKVAAKGNIKLDGQAKDQTIVTPATDKGMGVNSIAFGTEEYGTDTDTNSAVTLEVPGKAKKNEDATYVSELTWTLSQAEV